MSTPHSADDGSPEFRTVVGVWVSRDILPESGRVLAFSPSYKIGDFMRLRILDAQFIEMALEVTEWMDLESLESMGSVGRENPQMTAIEMAREEEERIKELRLLRTKLKTGEYDGKDIMDAWIALDELILLRQKIGK